MGWLKNPTARAEKATVPFNPNPSAAAAVTYEPNPAAFSSPAAAALLKKAAVRAFWADTSKPKIGASRVRKIPSTFPLASTTEIVTRAGVQIRFDVMNHHAAQYAATESSALITNIDESQREAVRALITSAVEAGRTVQETAKDLRNIVGLRPDQINALLSFRETGTARGLTIDQIEKKVARYASALLKQRGELIARTEILSAANKGQLELWHEARRSGQLDNTWLKQWILTHDELLCPYCEPLDETAIALNDSFQSDIGDVECPPLHPNCRCTMGLVKETA